MRSGSGLSGLGRMMRQYAEDRDGKIESGLHVWRFLDSLPKRAIRLMQRCTNGLREFPLQTDPSTGREIALFKGRGVKCKKPDRWTGIFPLRAVDHPRPYFIVPPKDCQACEFHEARKQFGRRRYAKCRWFRENSGLESPLQLLGSAMQTAKEIIGQ